MKEKPISIKNYGGNIIFVAPIINFNNELLIDLSGENGKGKSGKAESGKWQSGGTDWEESGP